jgi:hypothetical protein
MYFEFTLRIVNHQVSNQLKKKLFYGKCILGDMHLSEFFIDHKVELIFSSASFIL